MEKYLLTFRHYLRRAFLEPLNPLILTVLPMAIIAILSAVYGRNTQEDIYFNGYNMVSSQVAMIMMIMFQFLGGQAVLDYLYGDWKGPIKWRLRAAPCPVYGYLFSAVAASIIFSLVQGLVIVSVTALFMDAYWGNPIVLCLTILLVALLSHMFHIILFLLSEKKGTAEGIASTVVWAMLILSGGLIPLPQNAVTVFLSEYGTPFSLAMRTIESSGFIGSDMNRSLFCLLILMVITVILAVAVVILARRRKI